MVDDVARTSRSVGERNGLWAGRIMSHARSRESEPLVQFRMYALHSHVCCEFKCCDPVSQKVRKEWVAYAQR